MQPLRLPGSVGVNVGGKERSIRKFRLLSRAHDRFIESIWRKRERERCGWFVHHDFRVERCLDLDTFGLEIKKRENSVTCRRIIVTMNK